MRRSRILQRIEIDTVPIGDGNGYKKVSRTYLRNIEIDTVPIGDGNCQRVENLIFKMVLR